MSFLNRIFSADFKGAFQPTDKVRIETHPDDGKQSVLRFGDGGDDFLPVEGTPDEKRDLAEILSKVIESPTQLKKLRDLPLADRPVLAFESGAGCYGSCNGKRIMLSKKMGTGYRTAKTFVHELQHQYQFKHDGVDKYKNGLSLAEDILDDRLNESAAEMASCQYMFEIRNKNPQAHAVFIRESTQGMYARGMRSYAIAKAAGKSEGECVLAGMRGYAVNFKLARNYECDYHKDIENPPRFLHPENFADNVRKGREEAAVKFIDKALSGKKLDIVAAFKSHTVGMGIDGQLPDERIAKTLRSGKFAYVTSVTMRALDAYGRLYEKLTGKQHPNAGERLSVRNAYGVFDSRRANGAAGAMYRAKNMADGIEKAFKAPMNGDAGKIAAHHFYCADGREMFSFDGYDKDPDFYSKAVFFRPDARYEDAMRSPISQNVLNKRTETAEKMLSLLMRDADFARKLTACNLTTPVTFGFTQNAGSGRADKAKDLIVLSPLKTPEQLAVDFKKHFLTLTEPQNANTTAAKTSAPSPIARQAALKTNGGR